jgi:hypothetical protein
VDTASWRDLRYMQSNMKLHLIKSQRKFDFGDIGGSHECLTAVLNNYTVGISLSECGIFDRITTEKFQEHLNSLLLSHMYYFANMYHYHDEIDLAFEIFLFIQWFGNGFKMKKGLYQCVRIGLEKYIEEFGPVVHETADFRRVVEMGMRKRKFNFEHLENLEEPLNFMAEDYMKMNYERFHYKKQIKRNKAIKKRKDGGVVGGGDMFIQFYALNNEVNPPYDPAKELAERIAKKTLKKQAK